MLLAPAAIELRNFVKEEVVPGGLLATTPSDLNEVLQSTQAMEYGSSIRELPAPASFQGTTDGATGN
jgi:hypothetical protein